MRIISVAIPALEQVPVRLRPNGFTLIELSIVIAIVALVTAAGITMGSSVVDSAKRTATNNKLDAIESALSAYRMANDRLPCPGDASVLPSDSNYGVEAANKSTCTGGTPAANYSYAAKAGTVVEGAVPFKTLNLPAEFMYDAWGRKFAYSVWTPITAESGFTSYGISQNCGSMTIQNAGHTSRSTSNLYTLVSYGPDGNGGYTQNGGTTRYNGGVTNADELTNCHCNSNGTDNGNYTGTYIQKESSLDASDAKNPFQHLVRFKARWQMQNAYDTYSPAGSMPCTQGFIIDGYATMDIGYSVASADVNGDGIPDLIIGSYNDSAVYVVFGTKSGFPDPLPISSLNGTNGFTITDSYTAGFGMLVTTGDINGDGINDIIIGAPQSGTHFLAQRGAVFVVFGKQCGGSYTACTNVSVGSNGWYTTGAGIEIDGSPLGGGYLGNSVAAADVNGDGIADLIMYDASVASPGYSLYVLFGRKGAWPNGGLMVADPQNFATYNFVDGVNGIAYGGGYLDNGDASVAAGDVNGDGISDVVVNTGRAAYVIFGSKSLIPQTTIITTSGSASATVGSYNSLYACQPISSADTAVDTTIQSCGVSGCRTACTSSNITLSQNATGGDGQTPVAMTGNTVLLNAAFLNGTSGAEFDYPLGASGVSTAATGDVNGDGIADIILGNPGVSTYTGAVYIIFGHSAGWAGTTTLNAAFLNGVNGVEFDGTTTNTATGTYVATGDVNGDGVADVLIGAPWASPGGNTEAGSAYVVFGRKSGWPTTATTLSSAFLNGVNGSEFDGPGPYDLAGAVGAGDINGDGIADLFVGAYEAPNTGMIGYVYVYYGRKSGWPSSPFK